MSSTNNPNCARRRWASVRSLTTLAMAAGPVLAIMASAALAAEPTLSVTRDWDGDPRILHAAGDIGGDARAELMVSSVLEDLNAYQRDSSPRGYAVVSRFQEGGAAKGSALIDTDDDGRLELATTWSSGANQSTLTIYDGVTGTVRRMTMQDGGFRHNIGFGDVTGDGAKEIVIYGNNRVLLFNPATLGLIGTAYIPDQVGTMRVGDIQGDAREEIVFAGGRQLGDHASAFQIDSNGQGFAAQSVWSSSDNVLEVHLVDMNGDAKRELIAAQEDGQVLIHQGGDLASSAVLAMMDDIDGAWFGDYDNDGHLDVALRNHLSEVRLLDQAGQQIATTVLPNADSNYPGILVADFDGTGLPSIAFVSGFGVDVIDFTSAPENRWRVPDSDGLVAAAVVGDTTDTQQRVALLTHPAFGSPDEASVDFWKGRRLDDVGGTGGAWLVPALQWPLTATQDDVLALSGRYRSAEAIAVMGTIRSQTDSSLLMPTAWIFDSNGALVREQELASAEAVSHSVRIDIPGENQPFALNYVIRETPVQVSRLELLGLHDGTLRWSSPWLNGPFTSYRPLSVGDISGDGVADVIVVIANTAFAFSPGFAAAPLAQYADVRSATICASSDCATTFALARTNGIVEVYSGLGSAPSHSINLTGEVRGLALIRQPLRSELLLLTLDHLLGMRLFNVDTGMPVVPNTSVSFLANPTIEIADLDRDLSTDIVLVNNDDMAVYRLSNPEVVHLDGFE